jgi:transglutaminase-like putative cysteine protease
MSGRATGLRQGLPMALVAAATTWIGMWSWKGFTLNWGDFLGPLILVAIVVSVGGAVLRAAPITRRAGVALHVLLIVALLWLMLGGSPISPLASTRELAGSISDAWVSASTWAPPIPTTVPSIAPLMIPCGALALFLVDLTACWLRRVSLAGLPLLAVYCVPISLIGTGVSWLVFLVAACGFLLMMFLQESAHISRWGRPLGTSAAGADPHGFGVSTGASRTSATAVGSAAVVLGVILPVFIPTLHLDGLGMFGSGGGGSGVKVTNPITDMRRNLQRGKDVPLLDVTTDDPHPSYLRIAVLTQFNGLEWTTGSRQIISDQVADGIVPLEQGLSRSVPTTSYNYSVQATSDFDSSWLPTQFPVSDIEATGDWHWDVTTMDFIAGSGQPTTAGATWTMTSTQPKLSPFSMTHSLQAPQTIQSAYTGLPTTLPPLVSQLANKVTAHDTTRFQRAVDLQRWFRSTGHFRYSLKTTSGDGNSALATFLTRGKGGRVGYCEQFASAFAVMARSLQIPSRVAVGFLQPTQGVNGDWVYSAHDLHAWPELYFQGSGWVRFEPTPAVRATTTPAYTREPITKPGGPKKSQGPGAGGKTATDPTASQSVQKPHDQSGSSSSTGSGSHVPWLQLLIGLVVVGLLSALALVPRSLRRSRRSRRLAGHAEDAWAELRDTAVDLGVGWPARRSPHDTGRLLVGWFGAEPDGPPPVRPARGRGLAPAAEDALDGIVDTLERVRYARVAADVPGALADDVHTCIAALEHGSTRSALRRAHWMPRSVFAHGGGDSAQAVAGRQAEAVAAGGVVDHVG